jgi:hypothetical protein
MSINIGEIAGDEKATLSHLRHITRTNMPWRAACPSVFIVLVMRTK